MAAVWPINLRPPCGGRAAKLCKRRSGKWRTRASSFFCWVCWLSSAFVAGGRRHHIAGSWPRDRRGRIAGKVFDCEQRLVLGSILGRSLAKLLVPCFAEVRVSVSCRICIDLFASAAGRMRTDWRRPWLRPCQLPFASFCSPSGTPPRRILRPRCFLIPKRLSQNEWTRQARQPFRTALH